MEARACSQVKVERGNQAVGEAGVQGGAAGMRAQEGVRVGAAGV